MLREGDHAHELGRSSHGNDAVLTNLRPTKVDLVAAGFHPTRHLYRRIEGHTLQVTKSQLRRDPGHTASKKRVNNGTIHQCGNDAAVHTIGITAIARRGLPDRVSKAAPIHLEMEIQSVTITNTTGKTLVMQPGEFIRRQGGTICERRSRACTALVDFHRK